MKVTAGKTQKGEMGIADRKKDSPYSQELSSS